MLLHHTVTFPDCRLSFAIPAGLTPSPDFFMQRLASDVDYDRIQWLSPTASVSFVRIYADLPAPNGSGPLATLSVDMWLCRTPVAFSGDISHPQGLKACFAAISADGDGPIRDPAAMRDVEINGRVWVLVPDSGVLLSHLNARILVAARVGVTPNENGPETWSEAFKQCQDTVLGSLRVEALGLASHEARQ